jgi:hypothetical protein
MLAARNVAEDRGFWVSSERPVAGYVRRARRIAEEAGRTAAAPIVAVRRQRDDLERAVLDLEETRTTLERTRAELGRVKLQLQISQANRDERRATEAVEQVIEHVIERVADGGSGGGPREPTGLTAPELRDLALAVADLDANRTPGIVVVVGDSATTQVLAEVMPADRAVLVAPDLAALKVAEPVALIYLGSTSRAAVTTCLQRVAPLLVSGGRLVIGRYATSTEVRAAVDEYFRDRHMDFRFEQYQRLHVVRR